MEDKKPQPRANKLGPEESDKERKSEKERVDA